MLDSGRRASVPTDSLQLYYPMSLQSLGDAPVPTSTRHMVSMTRSLSSSHATAGNLSGGHHGHGGSPYALDSSAAYSHRMSYGAGALHPHAQGGSAYGMGGGSGYAMSSAPLSNPSSYLGSQQQQHHQGSLYGHHGGYAQSPQSHARMLPPGDEPQPQPRYTFPDTHSVSPQPGPGSGYATPQ